MLPASTLAGTPRPPLGCNCGRLPCTQSAPLHPEHRTDPLDRSRCRRCRLGALGSRTAAVRALHAVRTRRLSQSVRTPPAPAQLPTPPCDCGSCSFTPLSMPHVIATVPPGDGGDGAGSFYFRPVCAPGGAAQMAESARCAPCIDSHRCPPCMRLTLTLLTLSAQRTAPATAQGRFRGSPPRIPTSYPTFTTAGLSTLPYGQCAVAMCLDGLYMFY